MLLFNPLINKCFGTLTITLSIPITVEFLLQVLPTPWRDILLSPIFWSISISNFGRFWIMSVIFLYTPLYLKHIVHIEIGKNGVYSGIPYIIGCAFSLPISCLADHVIKEKYLSTVAVRLLFSFISE